MATYSFGDLKIEIADSEIDPVRVDWCGRGHERCPEATLAPMLASLTSKAVMTKRGIEMHFENLEFFNSATISVIIQYIRELQGRKVRLNVFFDDAHRWQRLFFDALRLFEKSDGLFSLHVARRKNTTL